MSLTVEEILEFDILRRVQAKAVAGIDYLNRDISWVHMSDFRDIADWLVGGELLLTHGQGFGSEPNAHRAYLRSLAEAGLSGLVVELHSTRAAFGKLPNNIIEEAERCRLPIVIIQPGTPFTEISREILPFIIDRKSGLGDIGNIGRKFTQLVLDGASVKRILNEFANFTQNPVVLENAAQQVVDCAPYDQSLDRVLIAWESRSNPQQDRPQVDDVFVDLIIPSHHSQEATSGEEGGRLHILGIEKSLSHRDRLVLERAALAVSLSLFVQGEGRTVMREAHTNLMSSIRRGDFCSERQVFRRAHALGLSLEGTNLTVIIIEPHLIPAEAEGVSQSESRELLSKALVDTRRTFTMAGYGAITSSIEADRISCIVGIKEGETLRSTLDSLGEKIIHGLHSTFAGSEIYIGASNSVMVDSVNRGFDQAQRALEYGLRVAGKEEVYHFEDLGFFQLLLRVTDGPDMARFVEDQLGSLLGYDANYSTALLPTLRAYLEKGGKKSAAARSLHLERRSLYHRLERIESVLGRDVDDADTQTQLALALCCLDLLEGTIPPKARRRISAESN